MMVSVVWLLIGVSEILMTESNANLIEKFIRDYDCQYDHFPFATLKRMCSEVTSVGIVGEVMCKSGAVLSKALGEFTVQFSRALGTGDRVTIIGEPRLETAFDLKFKSTVDTLLHMSCRINFSTGINGALVIVRNSRFGGVWGTEETSQPFFPYTVNTIFNTTVLLQDNYFQVYVDNVEMFTFPMLDQDQSVVQLVLEGDLLVHFVIQS